MILRLTTTHEPATDLGFLLHKNPGRLHDAETSFGRAYVFYPEANEKRCTATLVLDVDPIKIVRGKSKFGSRWNQYVNDRPYTATSFLTTAINRLYGTALTGKSKERQELAETEIPLEIELPVVSCRPGEGLIREIFEPLGYEVKTVRHPLDDQFSDFGESPYYGITLRGKKTVCDVLRQLSVLVPVLDDEKHYFVDRDEIDKLLRRAGEWLAEHPAKNKITRRYLRHSGGLTREALARLSQQDGQVDPDKEQEERLERLETEERTVSLHTQRLEAVVQVLKDEGAKSVLDLGCGEGRLLKMLMAERQFARVVGSDVSHSALERAASRLRLERMPRLQRERLTLMHGSLVYRDQRLEGFDAAAVVEVIEHLDEHRLASFARVLFEFARPRLVVLTTPNQEYNALFEGMEDGTMRHRDHRFEWTRSEFSDWGYSVAEKFGYSFERRDIGSLDETHGAPSQMGVFRR